MKILKKGNASKPLVFYGPARTVCRHCATDLEFTVDDVQTASKTEQAIASGHAVLDLSIVTVLKYVKYMRCPACGKKALFWKKECIVNKKDKKCATVEQVTETCEKEFNAYLIANFTNDRTRFR